MAASICVVDNKNNKKKKQIDYYDKRVSFMWLKWVSEWVDEIAWKKICYSIDDERSKWVDTYLKMVALGYRMCEQLQTFNHSLVFLPPSSLKFKKKEITLFYMHYNLYLKKIKSF